LERLRQHASKDSDQGFEGWTVDEAQVRAPAGM
jgi:hypothetical protein